MLSRTLSLVTKRHAAALGGAALLLAIAAVGAHVGSRHAAAASGDNLRTITADLAPCDPKGTGVAFDGTKLLLDCWFTGQIDVVNPGNGTAAGALTVLAPGDFGALSFDRTRNKLWACSGGFGVYLIDVTAATASYQFSGNGCTDGLSYDPTDDTIWSSCQECDSLFHYTTAGASLATVTGMTSKLGGHGAAGLAVVGADLYISNGFGQEIYRCSKDASSCALFAATGLKTDDLECDDVTFAPKTAIWSQYPFQRRLDAWEVSGTCAGQTPPTETPTRQPSASATSTTTATSTSTATSAPVRSATATPTSQVVNIIEQPTRPPAVPTNTPTPRSSPTARPAVGSVAGASTVTRLPNSGQGSTPTHATWIASLLALFALGCLMYRLARRSRL